MNIKQTASQYYLYETVSYAIKAVLAIIIAQILTTADLTNVVLFQKHVIVSAEYFYCYSDKFVIHYEAIIRAFPNKVFGFGHIPSCQYQEMKVCGQSERGRIKLGHDSG